jgi:polysaccharide pyruvyl transferase WcaK-like protein
MRAPLLNHRAHRESIRMSRLKKWIAVSRLRLSLAGAAQTGWYVGWVGHNNLGDEAIYAVIRDAFRPVRVFSPPPRLAADFGGGHHGKYDFAIIGGGTLIGEHGYLESLEHAMRSSATTIVFGAGVEDPTFWLTRDAARYDLRRWQPILNRCAYLGVRGPRSQRYLRQIGIESEVLGDPACMLVRPETAGRHSSERRLGLNLGSGWRGMFGDDQSVFETLLGFAKKIQGDGWDITPYVVYPADLPVATQFARRMGTSPSDIRCFYDNPGAFMDSVSEQSVFVGFKLHAVVLAYCAHVPAFMIEYRPKCRDFMESIGAEDFVIRADQLTVEGLLTKVEELHTRSGALIKRTAARLEYYRDKQIATARRFVSGDWNAVRSQAG